MTGVVFEHERDFEHALDVWIERAQAAAAAALSAAGQLVAQETAASFNVAPGPNRISGALAASVTTTAPKRIDSGYEAEVGPAGLAYVRRVELGKKGARSARAHPYFRPGYERAGGRFVDVFSAAWRDASPKGG